MTRELATLRAARETTAFDRARLMRQLTARLSEFRALLLGDVARARQALQQLLDGAIRFTPIMHGGRKTLAFQGETRLGVLLGGPLSSESVPNGI